MHSEHARDERNTPTPGCDGFDAEGPVDQPGRSGAEDESDRGSRSRRTADEPAHHRRRLLGRVDHRARELPSEREALDDAHGDEQHGSGHSNLCVGGEKAHDERRAAHHDDRHRQQRPPANPVSDHAQDQAAERPREEPEREDPERQQLLRRVARLREELPTDIACEVPVYGEVEPLEDVANQPRKRGANRRLPRTSVPSGYRSRVLTHISDHHVPRSPVRLAGGTPNARVAQW